MSGRRITRSTFRVCIVTCQGRTEPMVRAEPEFEIEDDLPGLLVAIPDGGDAADVRACLLKLLERYPPEPAEEA